MSRNESNAGTENRLAEAKREEKEGVRHSFLLVS